MAVQINDGRLSFSSNLDPGGFKKGSDEIKKNVTQLIVQLDSFKDASDKAFNIKTIADYNKKVEETQTEITRLRNAGKQGFDEFGNQIKKTTTLTDIFRSSLARIVGLIAVTFGITKLIGFGNAIVEVESKTEGVERAFNRINSPGLLDNLRKATSGTISDLELMQRTNLANSFNFPIDKLAAFFEYATRKSRDLGQDSAKFVQDLINGTVRGSVRILDNLGIAQGEVRAEYKKTGDYVQAVYNIIQKSLTDTGALADTVADKTSRTTALITDVEATIGKSNSGVIAYVYDTINKYLTFLNIALKDTDTRLTELGTKFGAEDNTKLVATFKADTPEGRAQAIKGYGDLIKKQQDDVANYDAKIQDVSNNLTLLQRVGRSVFTDLNKALEEKRDSAVVQLAQTRAELSALLGVQDAEKSATERQKEAEQQLAAQRKKDENERLAALARRNALQEQVTSLEAEYNDKALSQDEQQIQSVRDKFKKIAKAVTDFNADPRNKYKVDGSGIDATREKAVTDLILKQSLEVEKQNYEAQKQLFDQFDDYKLKAGQAAAEELFGGDVARYKTYVNYLKSLLPDPNDNTTAAKYLRDLLQNNLIPKAEGDEAAKQKKELVTLLLANQDYYTARKGIIEKANEDEARLNQLGYKEQADEVRVNAEKALTELAENNVKKLSAYKELFDGVGVLSEASARKDITALNNYIDAQQKAGTITKEAYLVIKKLLDDTTAALDQKLADKILAIGDAVQKIAGDFTGVNEGIGTFLSSIGKMVSSVGNIQKLKASFDDAKTSEDKFGAGVNLAVAGLSGLAQIYDVISNSAKQRKDAETAYANAILSSNNQINISLNEQIRLRASLSDNVFIKNYKADILDASLALDDANKKLIQSFVALQNGQAKDGTRNKVDPKSIVNSALGGAAAGAVIGGAIGTAIPIPIIGTVAGAVGGAIIGGIAGAIGGLFGGKKKEDKLVPLLSEFPELIQKDKDGVDQFNEALAKNLIQNNLVSDSTKVLLQNTIDLNDARQAAIDQINSDIKDLAGSLGDDLRNSLVKAFEDGTSAAQAFGDSVGAVIENIVSQFLFEDIFGSKFDDLQKSLKQSFGITGDQNAVDDLTQFFKDAAPLADAYTQALQAAKDAAATNGIDIFKPTNDSGSKTTLSGGIQSQLTEATGDILAGVFKGVQLNTYTTNTILSGHTLTFGQLLQLAQQHLETLLLIQTNTLRTADNTDTMIDQLTNINKNTQDTTGLQLRAAGKFGY